MGGQTFQPQPYAQLAKVLYAAGEMDTAKNIEANKVRLEVRDHAQYLQRSALTLPLFIAHKLLWAAFRLCFRYGLSPERATATWCVLLLLGWGATAVLNKAGFLVQNTSTAATVLTKAKKGDLVSTFPAPEDRTEPGTLPCHEAINNFLYAADVFVPLLDLRLDLRCDVRSADDGDLSIAQAWKAGPTLSCKSRQVARAFVRAPALWQFSRSLYASIGWLVISLAILTYSGVLRRWGEK